VTSASETRRRLRRARLRLHAAERGRASRRVCRALASARVFLRARSVAAYLPHGGEVDLRPLLAVAWGAGRECYLPVVGRGGMRFLPYGPGTPLRRNRYGIPEPDLPARLQARPLVIDLVLVPLVAFDGRGNRLGMGGGYYDRTFAFLHRRRHWRRPVLVGVAFGFQRVAALAPNPWDVTLDAVVTEEGLEWFRGAGPP
jgi:5-formyltetrahydrofolate cyclo-ligase